MEEKSIKHLEFIQNIIERMNKNSFQIKGWTITIVSALLMLYANSNNSVYIIVAIMPTILFWSLDAYYLQQERKFRGLYNDIIDNKRDIGLFKMSIQNYKKGKYSYWKILFSKTVCFLYICIIVCLIVISSIIKFSY